MNKDVVDNPYGAPAELSPITTKSSTTLIGLVILHVAFFCTNVFVLLFSFSLLPLFEEFGIELPLVSIWAYKLTRLKSLVGSVLLLFSCFSIFTHLKLKTSSPRIAVVFTTVVTLIWILFTVFFALGIFLPCVALTN